MKPDIHPKYFDSVEIRCSCGNIILAGSTKEKLRTELCSNCHPFYTGTQKLVDTAGRVDKFEARRKLASTMKDERKKKQEAKKKKPEVYKEKEIPKEVLERAGAVQKKEATGKWGKPLGETLSEEVVKEAAIEVKKSKSQSPNVKLRRKSKTKK